MSKTTARKEVYRDTADRAPRLEGSSAADEFERFFAEQFRVVPLAPAAANTAQAPAPASAPVRVEPRFDDPLMAELARIVGHAPASPPAPPHAANTEKTVLADFGSPVAPVAAAPVAVSQPAEIKPADALDAFEAELRRFDELHRATTQTVVLTHADPRTVAAPAAADPVRALEDELRRYESGSPQVNPVHANPVHADTVVAEHDPLADAHAGYAPEPVIAAAAPRSRKVVLMLGTAAAVALVGVIGTVAMNSGKRSFGGAPPVIAAKNQPMKEKPADPGGVEIPGQDRQVLARGTSEPPKAANVVSKEEQPVDLAQTPKRDVARVIMPATNGAGGTSPQPASSAPAPIIMPAGTQSPPAATPPATAGGFEAKRVRSVKVGPDGGAAAAAAAQAAAPVVPQAASITAMPAPTSAAEMPKAAAPTAAPKAEPKPAASAAKSEARPATAAKAQTTTPQPQRQAARTAPPPAASDDDEDDGADNKPLSLRPPANASATRAVARSTSTTPTTTASTGGGFAVQLAAAGSENEARSAAASMKKRYSALSAHNPSWRSSEVNGRTVYRVRVGGLSREKAGELCSQIKSDGGSCFVASN